MIHVAVMHLSEPAPDGRTEVVFASVDGEDYLPINQRPEPGSQEAIAALFEPDERGARHIKWARNAMRASWWPASAGVESFDHYTVDA